MDLNARSLEVHRRPTAQGFRELLRPEDSESVTLARLPDVSITVADLWA